MEQRVLGRTGRPVSVIGLGTWQLGADWGNVSEADAMEVLRAAVESGVTFFDTADVYGDGRSERVIGRFLAGQRRAGHHGRDQDGPPGRAATRALHAGELPRAGPTGPGSTWAPTGSTWSSCTARRPRCSPRTPCSTRSTRWCPRTRIAAYGVSVETCRPGADRDRAAGPGQRADHPERVPAQAARPGAARGGRGGCRHHRPGAARVRAALRPVHQGHHVRRRRPPQLQRPRRGVRRRGDVLRGGPRGGRRRARPSSRPSPAACPAALPRSGRCAGSSSSPG